MASCTGLSSLSVGGTWQGDRRGANTHASCRTDDHAARRALTRVRALPELLPLMDAITGPEVHKATQEMYELAQGVGLPCQLYGCGDLNYRRWVLGCTDV